MSTVRYFHELSGINIGFIVAFLSLLLFYSNSIWVLSAIVPNSARKSKHQEWKWRNIANPLIHSVITGCGACIYTQKWVKTLYIFTIIHHISLFWRFLTMGCLTRFLIQHRHDFSTIALRGAALALGVIMVLNIGLLLRILRSDFQQFQHKSSSEMAGSLNVDRIKTR